MTGVERVLVVGGGIGGLSTTVALRRAGFEVDVVEKNPAWDVYGVGIIQPGNALRALNDLGLAERCVDEGQACLGDKTWVLNGPVVANHDWPALVPGLPPGNGITRPRLHRILQDAVLDTGADVRTGVTFTGIADDGDEVTVDFTDGSARTYDLVVGADGIHSQVRETVFGPEIKPQYTGQVCWRYNLPRVEGLDKLWVWLGGNITAGFVPLAPDLMYMLTIEKPPEGEPIRLPREGLAAKYRERLAKFTGLVAEAREQVTDDDAVVYRPVENIVVPAPWHRGRVVLIGDAAHATTPHCGQGAAQAIEDGIVLAAELRAQATIADALDARLHGSALRALPHDRRGVRGRRPVDTDNSLPIDPDAQRHAVTMAAMAPI